MAEPSKHNLLSSLLLNYHYPLPCLLPSCYILLYSSTHSFSAPSSSQLPSWLLFQALARYHLQRLKSCMQRVLRGLQFQHLLLFLYLFQLLLKLLCPISIVGGLLTHYFRGVEGTKVIARSWQATARLCDTFHVSFLLK